MKVGDLVKLNTVDDSIMFGRLGIVVDIHAPTAVFVQWIGIEGTIGFRADSLEVVSEGR